MKPLLLTTAGLAIAMSLAACAKKEESRPAAQEEPGADVGDVTQLAEAAETIAAVDPDAPPADGTERFYGKEAFTIVSKQTGVETGDITEHVRDWGRRRAEIKNTSISVSGFTRSANQRVVQNGAEIVTIDNVTGTVTSMTNPIYDDIVARMRGKSGVEFGGEMMAAMGGRETGEKGSFAGQECDYWELASVGTKTCVTPWGGTLHTLTNMAGMSIEKTAVEVRLGDGGPDEAFAYDASKVEAAPDVGEIMKRAKGGGQ